VRPGFSVALFAVLAAGCSVQNVMRPNPPYRAVGGATIIGHRGGSLEAPENTVAAIEHAISVGADWQEVDVRLSADGEVMIMHDETVDRTTNGRGFVREMKRAELERLHAGAPRTADETIAVLQSFDLAPTDFGDRFRETTVPTLAEALDVPESRLMIEMKGDGTDYEALARAVCDVINRADAHQRVVVGAFETPLIEALHSCDPAIPLVGIAVMPEMLPVLLDLPLAVLAVHTSLGEIARRQAPLNVAVWTWTVYTVDEARRLAEAGIDGLITDIPSQVVAALRAPEDVRVPLSDTDRDTPPISATDRFRRFGGNR
jgi:glycerophosphoryl diester phosphodiesterase